MRTTAGSPIPAATAATATKRADEESHGPFGIKNAFSLTSRGARAIARFKRSGEYAIGADQRREGGPAPEEPGGKPPTFVASLRIAISAATAC
jgi:hypothetical protein